MGRSYQYDFKIIFKIIIFGVLIIGISLFTSCKFVEVDEENPLQDYEEHRVKVTQNGEIFLTEYNYTGSIVNFNKCLEIEKVKKREAVPENLYYSSEINSQQLLQSQLDSINQEFNKKLKINNSRTAQQECNVRKIEYEVGDKKSFWVYKQNFENKFGNKEKHEAVCNYSGKNCIVWFIDYENSGISVEDCENLGKKFDSLYEIETNILGSPQYKYKGLKVLSNDKKEYDLVDSQDKIEIIFSDILFDKDANNESVVLGFFSTGDLFPQGAYNYSNEGQMIFIDSQVYKNRPDMCYSTLAHEFNHLINFCYKQQFGLQCDTWFTEMISLLIEDGLQEYLQIEDIDSPKSRLVTHYLNKNYVHSPFVWFPNESPDVLYSYASAFALGAYLVRNYGGPELLYKIATSNKVNADAVEEALNELGYTYPLKYQSYNSFNTVVINLPYILINLKEAENENLLNINKSNQECYYTFNRTWNDSKFKNISFNKFCIKGSYSFENSKGQNITWNFEPVYFDSGETGYIYTSGFRIYDIGKDIKSFKISLPENYSLFYRTMFTQK